jgi:alkylation response protein AidB-like acyl-CoA dehydrogenase
VEQLVIEEELATAGVGRPHIGIGAWALPPIISRGTPEQRERWVEATLMGDLHWCQLFSEPGAGSDLASLATRAEPTERGWLLNGQKVWTSMAKQADWGICLARTDPAAPKHMGITYFIVDMHTPGLDIRPLRELTGAAMFNEVFFDDVFVPDECVIGDVNGGWGLARLTLANERVSMSSGATFGIGVESLLRLAQRRGTELTPSLEVQLGRLLAEAQSLRLMTHRSTLSALAGTDPGPQASLRKLLGAEHEQRVQELGLAMLGPEGATLDGPAGRWGQGMLATRCLTVAGGTSEIQRNVIAERLLGLPR